MEVVVKKEGDDTGQIISPGSPSGAEHKSDVFDFETNILSLKGNKDYEKLIRALCVLESQRSQALKDLDRLYEIQKEAKNDPLAFIEKIKNLEDLGYNGLQTIAPVPEIDWSKYKITLPPGSFRPQTRNAGSRQDKDESDKSDVVKIRGRVLNPGAKSETFNKLWTVEEQMKLEELLVKFPQEENESRRYSKIAEALGTRTLQQVTSRCQKYFRKLMKVGLPIPGRMPKTSKSEYLKGPKYASHKHSKNNSYLYPKSTFFPQSFPPVYMNGDEECQPGTSTVDLTKVKVEPEESDTDDDMKHNEDYRKIVLLKRVKRDLEVNDRTMQHSGFMCNLCHEDPLRGTRWHCADCHVDSIDFCSMCLVQQLEGAHPHPLDHRFIGFSKPQQEVWDQDYSYQNYFNGSTNYNYLDPNFLPQ